MAHRQPQNYVYKDNPDPKYCKKCRYCKQLIDKKATVCPFCKRNQPFTSTSQTLRAIQAKALQRSRLLQSSEVILWQKLSSCRLVPGE